MTVPGMTEKDTGNSKGEKQVLPFRGRMTTEIAPAKTTAKQVQRQQQVLPLRRKDDN
jgi:hypothetical protein